MNKYAVGKINIEADSEDPQLVVICDAPSVVGWDAGITMAPKHREMLLGMLAGATSNGVAFISPCRPVPEIIKKDERKLGEHIAEDAEDFKQALGYFTPKVCVTLGKLALRQTAGRAVKITSERGSFHTYERTGEAKVMPVQSPANVFTVPQLKPIMESDLRQVVAFADNGWRMPEGLSAQSLDYSWCMDLTEWLRNPPEALALDTETRGLVWFNKKSILTVQLCAEEGKAIVVPFDLDYFNNPALRGESTKGMPLLTARTLQTLQRQLRQLLALPEVRLVGHNCLSADTEVLTPDGWLPFPKLTSGREVMQFCCESGEMSFVTPSAIIRKNYEGEVLKWDTKFHQGVYTPEHRMVVKTVVPGQTWGFKEAGKVNASNWNGQMIPCSGQFEGSGLGVDLSWIKLAEAARADGHITENGIRFNFVKSRKILRLKALCETAGVPFSEKVETSRTRIYLRDSPCKQWILSLLFPSKKLGVWVWNMIREEKEAWLEEAKFWDGCDAHEGTCWTFSTADKQTAEWFQIMAHTTGYRFACRCAGNARGYSAHNKEAVIYSASVRKTEKAKIIKAAKKVKYKGIVYCVTVPTGAFMVRRNGVVWVTGNCKFDLHHLRQYGIEAANWQHDTMQLMHAVDENMQSKSLDECVRRYVPQMAGYADVLNADPVHLKKSRMDLVPHDKMLKYAAGDVDACIRLTPILLAEARKDPRNYNVYEKVKMPALRHVFLDHAERFGLPVDSAQLEILGTSLTTRCAALETDLLREAAEKWPAVLRFHQPKGLKFSRPDFVRDILFSADGMALEPMVATKKTKDLPPEEQLESTSKKDHLPYFEHIPWVAKLMEHQTLAALVKNFAGRQSEAEWGIIPRCKNGEYGKTVQEVFTKAGRALPPMAPVRLRGEVPAAPLPSTEFITDKGITLGTNGYYLYRLEEEEAKGFWWYLENVDPLAIHPSFGIHTAVTGRVNCNSPNLMNLPKRGEEAKEFRKIFKARPGYVFVEVDESQAELRVAACMAREKNMISIYANNGDIHIATACSVLGLTKAQWEALPASKKKENRQLSKGVNFGYIFGMWWKKFKQYVKTSYGVVVTDKQAEKSREAFFAAYPGLVKWHDDMKRFANKHKYVRSLHGALRRLPSLDSVEEFSRKEAERMSINSPVQGFASDIALIGATMFAKGANVETARLLGFIHDAVIIEVKQTHAEIMAAYLRWCMENQPLKEMFGLELPVPILADVSIGASLGAMEERTDIHAIRPPWIPR